MLSRRVGAAPEPTEAVLHRAVAGDRLAQGAVAELYYPRMRRWALLETGSTVLADEVVQEALIRWIRLGHTFSVGTRFTPWMRTLVRNCARDALRPRGVLRFLPWLRTAPSPDRRIDLQRGAAKALAALSVLTPRQRELLDLVDLQGLSAVEAAEELSITSGTARVHLHDARARLADVLSTDVHALVGKES